MTTAPAAILADDLTGACDSAGPFAAHGRRPWVAWNSEYYREPGTDVICACTESRNDGAMSAARKARHATRALCDLGATRFFKKIDSTLRGNWSSETFAVLDELRRNVAVVAPAFPAMGRQVVGGQLILNGTPQDVPIVLTAERGAHALARACYVNLAELRKGPVNLVKLVAQDNSDERLFVVDCEIDGDLDIVAAAVESIAESVLAVGSAGLAASLARRTTEFTDLPAFVAHQNQTENRSPNGGFAPSATVVFVGSSNQCTDSQVEALRECGSACEYELDDVPVEEFGECLAQGTCVVIRVRWRHGFVSAMNRLLDVCQRDARISFVLTGGDTAQLVCNCCEARGLWIHGELSPGLPWGRLCGGRFDDLRVATKAGGFGRPDSLLRIVEFLTKQECCTANPNCG